MFRERFSVQRLQASKDALQHDGRGRRGGASKRSRELVRLDVADDEEGQGSEEAEEVIEEEGEQPGEGQGRYPSRSRTRVAHYNPAEFEQQPRPRRMKEQVSKPKLAVAHAYLSLLSRLGGDLGS